MRYIGSKDNLLPFIDQVVGRLGITNGVFADLFAGTAVVGRHFKKRGFRVIASDLMAYSYALQIASIVQSTYPAFRGLVESSEVDLSGDCRSAAIQLGFDERARPLERVIAYLNSLEGEQGFTYTHYSYEGSKGARRYLTGVAASRIDAIRNRIERWRQAGLLTENEFWLLVAAVVEAVPGVSNVSGTYGAFLKHWDPRAFKRFELVRPDIVESNLGHEAYLGDANEIVRRIEADIIYLDPPYNARQYVTNYHLLETVARWDDPPLRGKTGLRPAADQRSVYCEVDRAGEALADLIDHANCHALLLSYNDEGLIPLKTIHSILERRGPVQVFRRPYRRFRSDGDRPGRVYRRENEVNEFIFCVRVKS